MQTADNKRLKVAIFSSKDFSAWQNPSFVGPEFIFAVTLSSEVTKVLKTKKNHSLDNFSSLEKFILEGAAHIQSLELSVHEKENTEHREKKIQNLLSSLETKSQAEIYTLFSTNESFSETKWKNKKCVILKEGQEAKDLSLAKSWGHSFFEKKWKLLRIEYPQVPFFQIESIKHKKTLENSLADHFYNSKDPIIQETYTDAKRKKKLLLHICCGPDAAGVIEQLKEEFDLTCFWYDPNIQPKAEYDKRLDAFVKVAELEKVPYIIGEYDVKNFLEEIKGLEHTPEQGAKCSKCYDMRLERAAVEAKKESCDLFSTTLAISPHKVQEKLKNFGELYSRKHEVPYLARNFMKMDGFKNSLDYCKENDIFRQDYCGCWFSLYEGGPTAKVQAKEWGFEKSQIDKKSYTVPE